MKVIYKNELRDKIDAVISKAVQDGKEIERIELGRKDYRELYDLLFPDDEDIENRISYRGVTIAYREY